MERPGILAPVVQDVLDRAREGGDGHQRPVGCPHLGQPDGRFWTAVRLCAPAVVPVVPVVPAVPVPAPFSAARPPAVG